MTRGISRLLAALIALPLASTTWASSICDSPGEADSSDVEYVRALEEVAGEAAAERAFQYLLGGEGDDSKAAKTEPMKSARWGSEVGVLYGAALRERAYRLRAEFELAQRDPKAAETRSPTLEERQKAFEAARAKFCTFAGHVLLPELRPDLFKHESSKVPAGTPKR